MDASVKKIMVDLKAGKYAPVYFLQGEETFYIDLIADFIEEHALSPADKAAEKAPFDNRSKIRCIAHSGKKPGLIATNYQKGKKPQKTKNRISASKQCGRLTPGESVPRWPHLNSPPLTSGQLPSASRWPE